jgi:hypothetical protein
MRIIINCKLHFSIIYFPSFCIFKIYSLQEGFKWILKSSKLYLTYSLWPVTSLELQVFFRLESTFGICCLTCSIYQPQCHREQKLYIRSERLERMV